MGEEIWKDIEGYEGHYQISNLGHVRGLDRYVRCGKDGKYKRLVKGKLLRPMKHSEGYLQVTLNKSGQAPQLFLIHRLVAEAFIPNLDNKEFVNHKDGNKQNPCWSNLEWSTRAENEAHAFATGLKKFSTKEHMHKMQEAAAVVNGRQVMCIETGVIYRSKCQAGKLLGVDESSIGYSIEKRRTIRVGTFVYV